MIDGCVFKFSLFHGWFVICQLKEIYFKGGQVYEELNGYLWGSGWFSCLCLSFSPLICFLVHLFGLCFFYCSNYRW